MKFSFVKKYKNNFISWGLFLITPILSFILVEYLNGNANIFAFHFIQFFMNLLVYYSIYFILLSIFNRFEVAMCIGLIFFSGYGIINSFVLEFRGSPILPFDVLSLQTATNVASEYRFVFDSTKLGVIILTVLILAGIIFIYHKKWLKPRKWKFLIGRFVPLLIAVILTGSTYALFYKTTILVDHDMSISTWSQSSGYHENGIMLSFVDNMTYLKPSVPESYRPSSIGTLMNNQNDELMYERLEETEVKNIIIIMNESFADLSVINEFETSEEYLPYSSSLENTISGYTYTSIFGGGTANSEFEFLTGNSLAFLPSGSMAYQMYVKDGVTSLNNTLKANGFYSQFIHTFYKSGWNRKKVYQLMNFDTQLYLDDMSFREEDLFRMYPSDKFTYQHVINQYENSTSDKNFLFCVTMQNHGGYDSELDEQIEILNSNEKYPLAEQYLTTLKESDQALEVLVDYFNQVDEPTIILQFGDHQPGVEKEFYEWLYGNDLIDLTLNEIQKRYMTPYLIWANYPIQEKNMDLSLNYLSTLLLQVAGIEMSDYNKFLNNLYFNFPVINAIGAINEDGLNYTLDELKNNPLINAYEQIQYNNLFDKKHRNRALFIGEPVIEIKNEDIILEEDIE